MLVIRPLCLLRNEANFTLGNFFNSLERHRTFNHDASEREIVYKPCGNVGKICLGETELHANARTHARGVGRGATPQVRADSRWRHTTRSPCAPTSTICRIAPPLWRPLRHLMASAWSCVWRGQIYAKTECRPRVTQVRWRIRWDSVDVTHTRGEEERGEWSSHKHTTTNHTTQHQIPQSHCRGPVRG